MKISIGSDHAGFDLRLAIIEGLNVMGHEVLDKGTMSKSESVDYPDYAKLVAEDVLANKADFGILVCSTGTGICMGANRMKGIRAAFLHNEDSARFSKEHNNANIICFGQKYHTAYMAMRFIEAYTKAEFSGDRHEQRLQKLDDLASD